MGITHRLNGRPPGSGGEVFDDAAEVRSSTEKRRRLRAGILNGDPAGPAGVETVAVHRHRTSLEGKGRRRMWGGGTGIITKRVSK